MDQQWIVRVVDAEEELHIVLLTYGVIEDASGGECDLLAYRNHLSRKRECVANMTFPSVAEAKAYCLKRYGVGLGDWKERLEFSFDFNFKYSVTSVGVPQPYPLPSEPPGESRVLFRFSPHEDENERQYEQLTICGNREGLEYFAKLLLLTAHSKEYDDWFHVHLENDPEVESDVEIVIRGPGYLKDFDGAGRARQKGHWVELAARDSEDEGGTHSG